MRKTWFTIACASALVCAVAVRALPYSLYYADDGRTLAMSWRRRLVKIYLSTSLRTPPANIKAGSDVETGPCQLSDIWRGYGQTHTV